MPTHASESTTKRVDLDDLLLNYDNFFLSIGLLVSLRISKDCSCSYRLSYNTV